MSCFLLGIVYDRQHVIQTSVDFLVTKADRSVFMFRLVGYWFFPCKKLIFFFFFKSWLPLLLIFLSFSCSGRIAVGSFQHDKAPQAMKSEFFFFLMEPTKEKDFIWNGLIFKARCSSFPKETSS